MGVAGMAHRVLRDLFDAALRLLPRRHRAAIGWRALRSSSGEFRALSDLMFPPFDGNVDWKSGLGDHVYCLYGLARSLAPEVVVEIGSARGRSTCALALACRQNGRGKVYAIDPHNVNDWTESGTGGQTLPFLRERLHDYELEDWCEIIRGESKDASQKWCRPIDLLFIDGDHTLEGVRQDFEQFSPWLRANGLVVFHDTAWPYAADPEGYRGAFPKQLGVHVFMNELREAGYHSVCVASHPGLSILGPRIGGFDYLRAGSDAAGAVKPGRATPNNQNNDHQKLAAPARTAR